jgi:hypothetical protein
MLVGRKQDYYEIALYSVVSSCTTRSHASSYSLVAGSLLNSLPLPAGHSLVLTDTILPCLKETESTRMKISQTQFPKPIKIGGAGVDELTPSWPRLNS